MIEITGDRVRFTHPLLASTHYGNTPISKRRELHRLLATVIDDEEERAQHVALGAEAPDGDLADGLERAGRLAARRGGHESAAQLLEDAARLTPLEQTDAQSARIIAAAEHRFTIGEVSRARHMLDELTPHLPAGPLRARARLQQALMSAGEPRVGLELLQAALADAGEDDRLRIRIEWDLSAAAFNRGRLAASRAYAESALRTAERLGDPELTARSLGELLLTLVTTGETIRDELIARLSGTQDLAATTSYYQPITAIAMARFWAGDFEGARPTLEHAARRALSRGEEWDRVAIETLLAQLELEVGNLALAEHHRQAAQEAIGEFTELLPWLAALDALFALRSGDLVESRAKSEQGLALAESNGALWQSARFTPRLAWLELLSGQPEVAHASLKQQREWLQSAAYGGA